VLLFILTGFAPIARLFTHTSLAFGPALHNVHLELGILDEVSALLAQISTRIASHESKFKPKFLKMFRSVDPRIFFRADAFG
jgi:hypothetical protein